MKAESKAEEFLRLIGPTGRQHLYMLRNAPVTLESYRGKWYLLVGHVAHMIMIYGQEADLRRVMQLLPWWRAATRYPGEGGPSA